MKFDKKIQTSSKFKSSIELSERTPMTSDFSHRSHSFNDIDYLFPNADGNNNIIKETLTKVGAEQNPDDVVIAEKDTNENSGNSEKSLDVHPWHFSRKRCLPNPDEKTNECQMKSKYPYNFESKKQLIHKNILKMSDVSSSEEETVNKNMPENRSKLFSPLIKPDGQALNKDVDLENILKTKCQIRQDDCSSTNSSIFTIKRIKGDTTKPQSNLIIRSEEDYVQNPDEVDKSGKG